MARLRIFALPKWHVKKCGYKPLHPQTIPLNTYFLMVKPPIPIPTHTFPPWSWLPIPPKKIGEGGLIRVFCRIRINIPNK